MSTVYKSYTVTAHSLEDTKSLYVALTKDQSSTETVPERLVGVEDQRKINELNTDYLLTDEEAEALRSDSRVLGVTDNSTKKIGRFAFQTSTFNKTTTETGEKSNWGLLRHTEDTNVFGTSTAAPGGTYDYVLDGTGVDIVIIDSGIQADHPEFEDASNISRVQQINWFTASGVSGTMPTDFYTDYDGHGTHVAGTAAGKTFGWGKNAHIYSIKLSGLQGASDPNSGLSDSQAFDCLLGWHNAKTNGRGTVVVNSWGYLVTWDTAQQALTFNESTYYSVTGGMYRGAPWSGATKDTSKGHTGSEFATGKFRFSYPITSTNADISQAIAAGIVVCNAAGNNSVKHDVLGGVDYDNYVSSTGLSDFYYHRGGAPHVKGASGFQVGAMGTNFVSSLEAKSTYSDSGPGVNIYAAGDRIISAMSNVNVDASTFNYHLNSSFKQQILSGTSMAAPQIAGLCALLLQAHPDWSVTQIYDWIVKNSKTILHTTGSTSDYTVTSSVHGGQNIVAYFPMNGRKVYEILNVIPTYWLSLLDSAPVEGNAASIVIDSVGNIYQFGYAGTNSNENMMLAKYNSIGIVQWQRNLSGPGREQGWAVAIDSNDDVYVVGQTGSYPNTDALVAKYNSSGAIQWQRVLSGATLETAKSVVIDSSDNVYVASNTDSTGAGGTDFLLHKYNSAGVLQSQRTFGAANNQYVGSIAVDLNDDVYFAGSSNEASAGSYDFIFAKDSAAGVLQWQRILGGGADDTAREITTDSSGNVYVVGETYVLADSRSALLLARYTSAGTLQWQRFLNGTGQDYGRAVVTDSIGDVYVLGYTSSTAEGSGLLQLLLAKYNPIGTLQWQRKLDAPSNGSGYSLKIDSADNLYLSGQIVSSLFGSSRFLAKLPNDGSLTGIYNIGGVRLAYAASSLTSQTSTYTSAASSLTFAASSLTSATATLTDASGSHTEYYKGVG